MTPTSPPGADRLGALGAAVAAGRPRAVRDHARLLQHDATLWPGGAAANAAWLGWLDALGRAPAHLEPIARLVVEVRAAGVTDVVLTGMGGSSLFPEVLARAFGSAPGHPRLWVIDSTDPAAVLRIEEEVPWGSALVIAASKSGGTVETRAHLACFLARLTQVHGTRAARRVVVITDPGSPLEHDAHAQRFLGVVAGDPDVGGRFSALSPFGLLPAAVLGIDLPDVLGRAHAAASAFAVDPWRDGGPALLAEVIATAHAAGRFALHLLLAEEAGGFGAWIEQLVAESSGKNGVGVLPLVTECAADVPIDRHRLVIAIGEQPGLGRLADAGVPVLVLPWEGPAQLGADVVRWTQAVALLCARLGVDPFDQPDVAAAKAATAHAIREGAPLEAPVALSEVLADLGDAAYLAVLAFVDPGGALANDLAAACRTLDGELGIPVSFGIGPRYLHSTGQLHKGGRPGGYFLVAVGPDPVDVAIPGQDVSFSRLKHAQAGGDLAALRAAGRRAVLVDPDALVAGVAAWSSRRAT